MIRRLIILLLIVGCFDEYSPIEQGDVYGCTDDTATNYDPAANSDDGSCEYDVYGCTLDFACNYEPDATIYDGSCDFFSCLVFGSI